MAKIVKLTQNGATVHPATTTSAVVDPDLRVPVDKLVEEINVSKLYPTGGVGGTNKYTLEGAIAKIPAKLRTVGIKCSFVDEGGAVNTYELGLGDANNINNWKETGSRGLDKLRNDFANSPIETVIVDYSWVANSVIFFSRPVSVLANRTYRVELDFGQQLEANKDINIELTKEGLPNKNVYSVLNTRTQKHSFEFCVDKDYDKITMLVNGVTSQYHCSLKIWNTTLVDMLYTYKSVYDLNGGGYIPSDIDILPQCTRLEDTLLWDNGTTGTQKGYRTFMMGCFGGMKLKLNIRISDSSVHVCAFDANKKFISSLLSGPLNYGGEIITTPVNACYIGIPDNSIYEHLMSVNVVGAGKRHVNLSPEFAEQGVSRLIGYKDLIKQELTLKQGYIHYNGSISIDASFVYSQPFSVKKGQVIMVSANAPSSVAVISKTDNDYNYIDPVVVGSGKKQYHHIAGEDGSYTICGNKNNPLDVYVGSAGLLEDISNIHSIAAHARTIENNLTSDREGAIKAGIVAKGINAFGGKGTQYKLPADVFNCNEGVCHIAFDFRIDEDVNSGSTDKTFFRIENAEHYIDFVVHCESTAVLEGCEYQDGHNLKTTRSGIPQYRSKFGVKSDIVTAGDRLNTYMTERGPHYAKTGDCLRPLAGNDLFSVEIRAVNSLGEEIEDTRSPEAQSVYAKWQDAYIEVTATGLNIVSTTNSLNESFKYADYADMTALFKAVYALNERVVNGAKIVIKDIGTYYYAANKADHAKLVQCKLYLGTEHPGRGEDTFHDGFPCYITYALDESWHTFELISDKESDRMTWCVDGQYIGGLNTPMYQASIVRQIIKGSELILGGTLQATYKDLLIESNEYTSAETSAYHFIVSKRTPYILNLFIHELFYMPYDGREVNATMDYVTAGGGIPDDMKHSNPNYHGDDSIMPYRRKLGFPSWVIEDLLVRLKAAHYQCIKKTDIPQILAGQGTNPYNRYYIIDVDDHQTYIYDRPELRNVFTRYDCHPCFALELGYYIGTDISDDTAGYNVKGFVEGYANDTNEHRVVLQKRLQSMLQSGWAIDIHGNQEGFTFQGKTCNEIRKAIKAAVDICKFYGLPINAWCYAGNYYTPNSNKLISSMGIEFGTSTHSHPIGKCYSNEFLPRVMVTTMLATNRRYIL